MKINYIFICLCLLILIIYVYAYNTGSCRIKNKKYICTDDFCLYKEFKFIINDEILNEINKIINMDDVKKRVSIVMYPEMIFDCAIPNRKGITISTNEIDKNCPKLIDLYKNQIRNIIEDITKLELAITDINMPTSCSIIIYNQKDDWINWHYDYNYYEGRFFTVLIPISNNKTCSKFQILDNDNNVITFELTNGNSIIFEGDNLYHRGSKLCENEERIFLSLQYVTKNEMSEINKTRIKLKDFAFTGSLFY